MTAARCLRHCSVIVAAAVLAGPTAPSASAACPNEAIRVEQGSTGLPDCGAYEMVSPPDMNGNGVETTYAVRADGEALVYGTINAFGQTQSSIAGKWLAKRTPQGWISTSLNPPTLGRSPTAYDEPVAMAFSSDLSVSLIGTRYPVDSLDASPYVTVSDPGNADLYLTEAGGDFTWVSHSGGLPDASGIDRALGGASADLKRIFFETKEPFTKEAEEQASAAKKVIEEEVARLEAEKAPLFKIRQKKHELEGFVGIQNLYEWHDGAVAPVNLSSEGRLIPGGAGVGRDYGVAAAFYSNGEYQAGDNNQGHPSDSTAVSESGRTVFFTAPVEPASAPRQLYARVDGENTVEASRCEASACEVEKERNGAPHGALFIAASPDGATVLFYSSDRLTEGAPEGGGIYRFQVASRTLSFLTSLQTSSIQSHHGGVLAVSGDLSYVYLCNGGGSVSVYHDGTVTPLATVLCSASTGAGGKGEPTAERSSSGVLAGIDQGEPRLTPDSGWMFSTTAGPQDVQKGEEEVQAGRRKLEEDETLCEAGAKPYYCEGGGGMLLAEADIQGGERTVEEGRQFSAYENDGHSEVYLYEPASAALRCLSCRAGGVPAQGDSYLDKTAVAIGGSGAHQSPDGYGIAVRNLAQSGGRAFFVSEDALALHDVNGNQDVYEWERVGTGGCTSASAAYRSASEGCVYLISSGASPAGAVLEGVSAEGEDVFFSTYASLVAQDAGTELELYDVRLDGGFPAQNAGASCNSASECKVAAVPAGTFGPPASTTVSGNDNLKPARPKRPRREQRLKFALKRCAARYRHNRHGLQLCKRRARRRLRAHPAAHERRDRRNHRQAHAGRVHGTSRSRGRGR